MHVRVVFCRVDVVLLLSAVFEDCRYKFFAFGLELPEIEMS